MVIPRATQENRRASGAGECRGGSPIERDKPAIFTRALLTVEIYPGINLAMLDPEDFSNAPSSIYRLRRPTAARHRLAGRGRPCRQKICRQRIDLSNSDFR